MTGKEIKALQSKLVAPPNCRKIFSHEVRTRQGPALKVEVYPSEKDSEVLIASFLLEKNPTAEMINKVIAEKWAAGVNYAELIAKQVDGMYLGIALDEAYPLIWRHIERLKDDIAYLNAEIEDLKGLLDEANA